MSRTETREYEKYIYAREVIFNNNVFSFERYNDPYERSAKETKWRGLALEKTRFQNITISYYTECTRSFNKLLDRYRERGVLYYAPVITNVANYNRQFTFYEQVTDKFVARWIMDLRTVQLLYTLGYCRVTTPWRRIRENPSLPINH